MARSLFPAVSASLLCATLGGCETTPQVVDVNKPAARCFQAGDFRSWRATPDGKTMYIRVEPRSYYRIDLAGRCPTLNSPGAFLITTFRGPTTVCSNLDWDLKVADSSAFPIPCIVEKMTPLTPAEVEQVPEKLRP